MKNLLKITLTLLTGIVISVGIFRPGLLMGTSASTAVGNWYQQFLPNLNGRQIVDITFTDSLTGYAITSRLSVSDSPFILKTTNSGNNWNIIYNNSDTSLFTCLYFLNQNTGYVGGYIETNFNFSILKTTNGGVNWNNVNTPFDTYQDDLFVLNEDTIWFVMDELSTGGVFFTSNGGANWQVQYQGNNPGHIYMYDRNLGFISPPTTGALYRTTNSGLNWLQVPGADGFTDIKFSNSLTGYKCKSTIKKTTDGGLNWVQQILPTGGNIIGSGMSKISYISPGSDTLWGLSGSIIVGSGIRGTLFHTSNGGINWSFQLPDTSINIPEYYYGTFIDKYHGWNYNPINTGIHTTTGGDPVFISGIHQISNEIPKDYILFQNYPNPFNPYTKIRYSVKSSKDGSTLNVNITVYDIRGKQIAELVNQKQNAGIYEVDFDGSKYSSGIYFYKLIVRSEREVYTETKRMVLVK